MGAGWNMAKAGVIFCLILSAALAVCAALLLCPDCGTELGPDDKVCPHCHRALPERKVSDDTSQNSGKGAKEQVGAALILEAAEADIASAEALMSAGAGDIDLARLFLANASALLLLAEGSGSNLAERVRATARACDLSIRSGSSVCPVCGGTGKAYLQVKTLSGGTNTQAVAGQVCSACQGTGRVARKLTAAEELAARAGAMRRFESEQRTRGRVALGLVWIPAQMDGTLSDRQVAVLRRAVPPPCPKCGGVGKLDCKTCGGAGTLPCPNKACVRGRVEVKIEGLSGTTLTRFEKCPACGGTGMVKCSSCGGTGGLVCPSCHGDGKAPLCGKCGGQGAVVCSRCGGSGVSRGQPCAACGGDGIILCPVCHGDGRK